MNRIASQTRSSLQLAILILALSIVGCARVQTEPFDQFSQSTKQLRKGADDVLSIVNDRNRTRFIEETAGASMTADGADAVQNLMLDRGPPEDPFGWSWMSETPPLFIESERFRGSVYLLNSTLVSYADLLASLAGENLIPQQEFDALSTDLNANVRAATSSLGVTVPNQDLAIISTAASAAFREYLESQRREALELAIEENQANIIAISVLMQDALRISTRNLRQNYNQESSAAAFRLTPGSQDSLASRKTKVKQLIELNEEYITRLATLRTLDQSYRTLPQAHRELIAAADASTFSIAAIQQLYDNGQHLRRLYEEPSSGGVSSE